MREVIDSVLEWKAAGKKVALATLYRVAGSSPQPPGAAMAVAESGEAVGSVSGGCVEGALYEVCQQVLAGAPPQSVTYGISDDQAFEVGLTCGGTLEIFVEHVDW
jgi:xanthine dehydrogenase accessory factor